MLRKTKIICTLGPAVDDEESIRKLIRGGMDAARFNFSHGSHPEHLERLNRLKAVPPGYPAPAENRPGQHEPPGGHYPGHQGPRNPHQGL